MYHVDIVAIKNIEIHVLHTKNNVCCKFNFCISILISFYIVAVEKINELLFCSKPLELGNKEKNELLNYCDQLNLCRI